MRKRKREREKGRQKEGEGKKGTRRAGGHREWRPHRGHSRLCGPRTAPSSGSLAAAQAPPSPEAHAACPAVSTRRPRTGRPGSACARLSLAGCQGAPGRGITTWCRGDAPGLFSQGAVQAAGCFPFPYYSEKRKKKASPLPPLPHCFSTVRRHFIFYEGQLRYNAALFSTVQRGESAPCIHTSLPSWTALPPSPPL